MVVSSSLWRRRCLSVGMSGGIIMTMLNTVCGKVTLRSMSSNINTLSVSINNTNDYNELSANWNIQATTGGDDPNGSWNQTQVLTAIGFIIAGILIVAGMWWLWRRCQLPHASSLHQQGGQFQLVATMAASAAAAAGPSSISMTVLQSPVPQSMTTTSISTSSSAPTAAIVTPTKAPAGVPFMNPNSIDVVVKITPSIDGTSTLTTIALNGEDGAANGGGCGCGCDRGPCTCGDVCVSEAAMPPRYNGDGSLDTTSTYTGATNDTKFTSINMVPAAGTFVDAAEYKGVPPPIEVSAISPKQPLAVVVASRAQMVWNVPNSSVEASPLERILFCRC